MLPSIEFVKEKFAEYNGLLFAGRLPEIPIRLVKARSFIGQCVSKVRRLQDGRQLHYDFYFKFSTCYDLPQKVLEDTVIHEMIHYFIAFHGLPDSSTHGNIFKAIMSGINRTFDRNITISHRLESDMSKDIGDCQTRIAGKWHIIAFVTYRDGQTGIKVLPRVARRVIDYHHSVSSVREIKSVELYLHNAAYFDCFPVSSALKVHILPREIIENNLEGARKIRITSRGLSTE